MGVSVCNPSTQERTHVVSLMFVRTERSAVSGEASLGSSAQRFSVPWAIVHWRGGFFDEYLLLCIHLVCMYDCAACTCLVSVEARRGH